LSKASSRHRQAARPSQVCHNAIRRDARFPKLKLIVIGLQDAGVKIRDPTARISRPRRRPGARSRPDQPCHSVEEPPIQGCRGAAVARAAMMAWPEASEVRLPALESAIDEQIDAGDERRCRAQQEDRGSDHLLEGGNARHRRLTFRRLGCPFSADSGFVNAESASIGRKPRWASAA
jgi:hypothetical protein